MFYVKSDNCMPLDAIADPRLRRLLDYWRRLCAGRPLPAQGDIDLAALDEHWSRLHILEVLGPCRFLYRVYASAVTNPDVCDMTGLTTGDYKDLAFGEMVTRHLRHCVEQRTPVYRHIVASLGGQVYEYFRLILPLADDADGVGMLLASPARVAVPVGLPSRQTPAADRVRG